MVLLHLWDAQLQCPKWKHEEAHGGGAGAGPAGVTVPALLCHLLLLPRLLSRALTMACAEFLLTSRLRRKTRPGVWVALPGRQELASSGLLDGYTLKSSA